MRCLSFKLNGENVKNLRAHVADQLALRDIQFEDRGHPFGVGCAAQCGGDLLSCGISFAERSVRVEVLCVTMPTLAQATEQTLTQALAALTKLSAGLPFGEYFLHPHLSVPAVHSEVEYEQGTDESQVAAEVVDVVVDLFIAYCSNTATFLSPPFTLLKESDTQADEMESR